jgi:uncharacterized membrane protein YgcG
MSRLTVFEPTKRALMFLLMLGMLLGSAGALASCSSDDDAATATPLKAFVSPVDGKTYCAWVENPHECPGPPGPPAAPFAMPQDEPRHDPGMSNMDFLLMMALFDYHTTYSPYYGGIGYYNHYVSPAWTRYPGTYYSGPGRTTIHTTNVSVYTSSASKFDTKYATQERAGQKNAVYKTANGKTYKGTEVPRSAFKGTNVPAQYPTDSTKKVNTNPVTPKQGSDSPASKSRYGSSSSSSSSKSSSSSSSSSGRSSSGSSSKSGK